MPAPPNFWTRWRVRCGYLAAAIYLLLASPAPAFMAAGAALAAVGLLVRAAAAGHLRKYEELATSGPYAWTRNPLYFGSAFLALGFAVAGHSVAAGLLVAAYFAAFYSPVMKQEEADLCGLYGAAFEKYAAAVPLFWPRPPRPEAGAKSDSPGPEFSWALYRRNREYQALLGFLSGLALLWLRMWLRHHAGWSCGR